MEFLQSCPCCLSDVDVIDLKPDAPVEQPHEFLVQCGHCGKTATQTYPSLRMLAVDWNQRSQQVSRF